MGKWLTLRDVAEELQIPIRTIQYYSANDADFPRIYRFGKRHSRIERADYEAWKGRKKMTD